MQFLRVHTRARSDGITPEGKAMPRDTYENIWEFRTKQFAVVYSVCPEDDLDLSWDEDGETARGLESGRYVAFVARIEVIHMETGIVLGSDHLGNCVYESARAFINHRGAQAPTYFVDMVRGAIDEARKNAASFPWLRKAA